MPKSWDMLIRADRVNWRQYTLTASLDPENIIKENTSIPLFVFEYFSQKEISGLIHETLEKSRLFHFEESDGIGLISLLVAITKLKVHLDFLNDEQATELVERFERKRKKERL